MCVITPDGENINFAPLIELMSDRTYSLSGPQNISKRLQEIHDLLSTHVPTIKGSVVDADRWANANYLLVEMRETFERMQMQTPNLDNAQQTHLPG